jgi:hypothetical protein
LVTDHLSWLKKELSRRVFAPQSHLECFISSTRMWSGMQLFQCLKCDWNGETSMAQGESANPIRIKKSSWNEEQPWLKYLSERRLLSGWGYNERRQDYLEWWLLLSFLPNGEWVRLIMLFIIVFFKR